MRKAAGLLAYSLLLTVAMLARSGGEVQAQTISAHGLQADAAILRRALDELHPGLYRYNTMAQTDAAFATLAAELNHDLTLAQAYVAFATFTATIESGATLANFSEQPDAVASLFAGDNRVPFDFEWVDGDMVVTRDFTHDHALPRGTRIAILDDVPTSDILARLLAVTPGDGANDAERIALLGVRGTTKYEAFDVFWPLLFPQPSPAAAASPRIVIFPPHGETWHGMNVQALTFAQRSAAVQQPARTFSWRYLPDGAAYLRMSTWPLDDAPFDWKAWLDAHLDELGRRNPRALVIDVRGNAGGVDAGGADAGDPILAHLVTHDVQAPAMKALVRYRAVPSDLAPYLTASHPAVNNLGASAADLQPPWPTAPAVPYYVLERGAGPDAGPIHARAPHYAGRVFVLVDAGVRGAAFRFAQIVQQNKLGTLLGQPTGGNQRGTDGGPFFFLHLPNSKIEIDVPLIGAFPSTPQPNAGLTPDIVVTPTADDIASSRDPVIDEVARILATPA